MKKYITFILISLLLSGCNTKSLAISENISNLNSTWIWDITNLTDLNTISNLKKANIKEVYINTGWSPEKNQFYFNENPLIYNTFIKNSNNNNIKVHALLSDNNWALTENYSDFQSQVNTILNFNEKYNNKFYAIHLDIEPYLFDDWEQHKTFYLSSYLENLKNIKTLIDNHNIENNDNLKLVLDIPFWFSQSQFNINNNNLLNEFFKYTDELVIMNYTQNQQDFINRGNEILKQINNNDKKIKMAIELNDSKENISLNNLTFDELSSYLIDSINIFKQFDNFSGIAIHDYNASLNYIMKN